MPILVTGCFQDRIRTLDLGLKSPHFTQVLGEQGVYSLTVYHTKTLTILTLRTVQAANKKTIHSATWCLIHSMLPPWFCASNATRRSRSSFRHWHRGQTSCISTNWSPVPWLFFRYCCHQLRRSFCHIKTSRRTNATRIHGKTGDFCSNRNFMKQEIWDFTDLSLQRVPAFFPKGSCFFRIKWKKQPPAFWRSG